MKTRSFLMVLTLILSPLSFAEGGKNQRQASTIVDKTKSVEDNITACNSLIRSHCGDKSNDECMKQPSPKSAQVSMCVAYMMKNPMKGMEKGLHVSFQDLYKNLISRKGDMGQCFKKAQSVCGEDASVESCLLSNPGAFPSFCRSLMNDSMDEMKAVYETDPEMAGCADSLMKQCKLDLSDVNETKEVTMKKIQAYQDCVDKKVKETGSCKGIINSQTKKGAKTQLIN